jgi:hypothetical protein
MGGKFLKDKKPLGSSQQGKPGYFLGIWGFSEIGIKNIDF